VPLPSEQEEKDDDEPKNVGHLRISERSDDNVGDEVKSQSSE